METSNHYSPSELANVGEVKSKCSNGTTRTAAGNRSRETPNSNEPHDEKLSALQQHIQFWDRDNDGIIWPLDVYRGFRDLGFGLFFSIGSLLIPVFFSYPTRLGHSLLPDPLLRIYVRDIHKAKHGSDTGVYDFDGNFDGERFEQLYARFDPGGSSSSQGLGAREVYELWKKDRCAADPAGWTFAAMEWWTTWVLLQKDGRVRKDDLRACYDGSLFWKIYEERQAERRGRSGEEEEKKHTAMRNFFDPS
ncbi:putative peroxygenase 3 [Paramyrothecium foliicola]|nr:putative peroxygenase 3 [Paramyrothecium foliicola]